MYRAYLVPDWYYQYKAGTALQQERVRRLMRTEPVGKTAYDKTRASDGPQDGLRAKAIWAIWSVLGAAAGCGFIYMIVRVFVS